MSTASASVSSPLSLLRSVADFLFQPTQPFALLEPAPVAVSAGAAASATTAAAAAAAQRTALHAAAGSGFNNEVMAAAARAARGVNSGSGSAVSASSSSSVSWAALAGWALGVALLRGAQLLLAQRRLRIQQRRDAELAHQAAHATAARVRDLIRTLQLTAHPEGGQYRRIYESRIQMRSTAGIAVQEEGQQAGSAPVLHMPRPLCTAIYFLLSSAPSAGHASAGAAAADIYGEVSHLHRIPCAEAWLHVEGDPLVVVSVDEQTGEMTETLLGPLAPTPAAGAADGGAIPDLVDASRRSPLDGLFVRPASSAVSSDEPLTPQQQLTQHAVTAAATKVSAVPAAPAPHPFHVVEPGRWFGARLADDLDVPSSSCAEAGVACAPAAAAGGRRRYGYALVSCVVSPGFCFDDFELLTQAELRRLRVCEQLQRRLSTAAAAMAPSGALNADAVWRRKTAQLQAMVLKTAAHS